MAPDPASDETLQKLEGVIDQAAELAQKSITAYAAHAKVMAKDLVGSGSVDPAKITDEVTKTWVSMVSDASQAWMLWMQGLRIVAGQDDKPSSP